MYIFVQQLLFYRLRTVFKYFKQLQVFQQVVVSPVDSSLSLGSGDDPQRQRAARDDPQRQSRARDFKTYQDSGCPLNNWCHWAMKI